MKNVIVQLISFMIHADQVSNKAICIKAINNQSKEETTNWIWLKAALLCE